MVYSESGSVSDGNRASLSPVYFYLHFDGAFCEAETNPPFALPLAGAFDVQSVRPLLEKLVHCQKEAASQRLFEISLFRSLLYFLYCSDQEEKNSLPYRILTAVSSHMEQPVSLGSLSEELDIARIIWGVYSAGSTGYRCAGMPTVCGFKGEAAASGNQ